MSRLRLADTSAWVWARRPAYPQLRSLFEGEAEAGALATCDPVRFELLQSTRNVEEFRALRGYLALMRDFVVGKRQWDRALDVYEALAAQGGAHQRSVKHADLLIAAAAEAGEVAVLHYDEDFERIAAITGQPHEWLAPRGSLR